MYEIKLDRYSKYSLCCKIIGDKDGHDLYWHTNVSNKTQVLIWGTQTGLSIITTLVNNSNDYLIVVSEHPLTPEILQAIEGEKCIYMCIVCS